MNIAEIKAFLESNKNQTDVQGFLGELTAVSADKVTGFLQTDEGKRLLQPQLDSYHAKSLESWKTNNLSNLVDSEINKRNPAKTEAEIRLEGLLKDLEAEKAVSAREKLVNKALKVADEKALPKGVIDFFIGEDEEKTLSNLTTLETEYTKAVQAAIDAKFKVGGRVVDPGSTGSEDSLGKQIAAQYGKSTEGLEEKRESFFK